MKRIAQYLLVVVICCSIVPAQCFAMGDADPSTVVAENERPSQQPTDTDVVVQQVGGSTGVSTEQESVPSTIRSGMMISYVQTRGLSGDASDEVVELYNNSDVMVDVTDWCVKRVSSGEGKTITPVACLASPDATERILVPAHQTILIASKVTADFVIKSPGMSDDGGAVFIVDNMGAQVDAVAWGNNTNYAEGGTAALASGMKSGMALERIRMQSGGFVDTDHSVTDIHSVPIRAAFSYGALQSAVDLCRNITGYQSIIPLGLERTVLGDCTELPKVNFCEGIELSEIAANSDQQFIEVYNATDDIVDMSGCQLATNRTSARYVFDDLALRPGEYHAVSVSDTSLTLTKTTTGTVYLLSSDGVIEVQAVTYKNLTASTSWARIGGGWQQTYILTPGQPNNYEQYLACSEGYIRSQDTGRCNKVVVATSTLCRDDQYRSEETNRCRNVVTANVPTPCKDGQYRSEETNRCRSIVLAVASVLKPCADNQFRNPETNRCKTIASSDDVALADCGEGRERNADTHRCRNVAAKSVPQAAFGVEPIAQGGTAFIGWWALGGVGLLALGYAGWEWRQEMVTAIRKVGSFFHTHK